MQLRKRRNETVILNKPPDLQFRCNTWKLALIGHDIQNIAKLEDSDTETITAILSDMPDDLVLTALGHGHQHRIAAFLRSQRTLKPLTSLLPSQNGTRPKQKRPRRKKPAPVPPTPQQVAFTATLHPAFRNWRKI